MASSKSKPTKKAKAEPTVATRPRDLLKLSDSPVHPFDEMHGVETSGLVPAKNLVTGHANDEHVTAYYGVAPSILRRLIGHWRETVPRYPISSYTFIDIGCGKGRGLMVASEFAFRKVVGVELNPAMAAVARENVLRWDEAHASDPTAELIAPIEVLEQDALQLELPMGPVLLFLFHPFEAPVLKALLRSIETQFGTRAKGGEEPVLDLLYVNAECANVLDKHPAFEQFFLDKVQMSPEDHAADLEAIAQQKEYGSTGDEECAIYRYVGRAKGPVFKPAA